MILCAIRLMLCPRRPTIARRRRRIYGRRSTCESPTRTLRAPPGAFRDPPVDLRDPPDGFLAHPAEDFLAPVEDFRAPPDALRAPPADRCELRAPLRDPPGAPTRASDSAHHFPVVRVQIVAGVDVRIVRIHRADTIEFVVLSFVVTCHACVTSCRAYRNNDALRCEFRPREPLWWCVNKGVRTMTVVNSNLPPDARPAP